MTASITSISRKADSDREPSHPGEPSDRVVLQFGDRVLKGFADRRAWERALESGLAPEAKAGVFFPEQLQFRPLGAEHGQPISLEGLKAAFFVKRFDGPGLDEMRFHDHRSPLTSLWVRVVFRDSEVIEGLVDNRVAFILQAGFFLTPTDPEANHSLIYVAKGQVRDFQVLGLRSASKESLMK